jgi:hypothetical protein
MKRLALSGTLSALFLLTDASRVASTQEATAPLRGAIDLTIGSADDTRDAYIFGNINGLALLEDGRILVADNSTNDVRVFRPDGTHLFTIGRAGEGPGDLRRPCCLAIASDGRLWIREVGNRRYSIFELSASRATFVHTIRQQVANPRGFDDRIQWDERGRVVDIGQLGRDRMQLAFVDSAGNAARWDTLTSPPADSLAFMEVRRQVTGGVATYWYHQPHGPNELRAYGPRGETAEAVSSNYAVSWFDAARRRIALIRRVVDPPGLSPRERREASSELDRIAREAGVARSALRFDVPARKPVLRSLGFDLDGRLWIERTVPHGQPREADLYERDGRRIAVMVWPAHVSLSHRTARGRTAVGVAFDSLGTSTVVRLRFR